MPGTGIRSRSNAKSFKGKKGKKANAPNPFRGSKASLSSRWQSDTTSTLRRCSSEPGVKFFDGEGSSSFSGLLYDNDSCSNMLCSYSSSSSLSSGLTAYSALFASSQSLYVDQLQGYNRESKVVVNVLVEGSPGPIRAMVKLGSSVEETINLVLEKFQQERRNSNLQNQPSTSYELHHSFFSLESLNKSSPIGDAGSRNLYLRKSSRSEAETGVSETSLEIKPRSSRSCSVTLCLLVELFVRRLGSIPVRTGWKAILCLQ